LLAAQHGHFWEVHDALLAGKADPLTDDKLIAAGVAAGLEESDIPAAWEDPARKWRPALDRLPARRFGIHRRPPPFLDGPCARLPMAAASLAALIDDVKTLEASITAQGTAPDMYYSKLMRGAIPASDPMPDHQASAAP